MDDILRSEVIIVLQQQQNGVHVEDFAGLFRKTFGYEFKLSNYGYKSLKSILNDMKDDVVLIESTHGLVIKCVSLSDESAQLSGSGVSQTDVPHVLKSQTSSTPDPVATQDNKTGNQTENEHSSTAQLGTNTSISNIPSSGQKPSNNQLHVFDQIQFQHANSPNEQSDKKITTNVAKASSSSSKKMSSTQHNCTTKTEKSQPVQKHSKTAMPQKSKHFATSRPRKHSTNSVSKIKTEKIVSNSSYIQQNKLTRTIAPSGTGTKQLPYKQTKAGIKTSLAKQNMQQQTLSNQLVLPVNVLYNRNMQGYQNVQTVSKVQENVLYADAIKKNLNLRQSAFQSTPIRNAQQNKENHNLQTFHPSPCIPRTEHMAPALSPTVKQNIQKVLMIHTNGISIFQLQKVYNFMFRQPLSLNRFSSMKQLLMKIKDVVKIQGLGVQTRLYPISSDVIPTPTVCDQYGFSLLIKETSMENDNVLVNANLGKTDTAEECYSLSSMKTNTEPPKMVEVNVPTLSSRKETCKTSSVVNLETSTNLVQSLMSTTKDCNPLLLQSLTNSHSSSHSKSQLESPVAQETCSRKQEFIYNLLGIPSKHITEHPRKNTAVGLLQASYPLNHSSSCSKVAHSVQKETTLPGPSQMLCNPGLIQENNVLDIQEWPKLSQNHLYKKPRQLERPCLQSECKNDQLIMTQPGESLSSLTQQESNGTAVSLSSQTHQQVSDSFSQAHQQTPEQIKSSLSLQTPLQTPEQIKSSLPLQTHLQTPEQIKSSLSLQTPLQTPEQIKSSLSLQTPLQTPEKIKSSLSLQTPLQTPEQIKSSLSQPHQHVSNANMKNIIDQITSSSQTYKLVSDSNTTNTSEQTSSFLKTHQQMSVSKKNTVKLKCLSSEAHKQEHESNIMKTPEQICFSSSQSHQQILNTHMKKIPVEFQASEPHKKICNCHMIATPGNEESSKLLQQLSFFYENKPLESTKAKSSNLSQKDFDSHTMLVSEQTGSHNHCKLQTESYTKKTPGQKESFSYEQQNMYNSNIGKEIGQTGFSSSSNTTTERMQTAFPSSKPDKKIPGLQPNSKPSAKQRKKRSKSLVKKTECQSTQLDHNNIIPSQIACAGQESEFHIDNIKTPTPPTSQLHPKISVSHVENAKLFSSESIYSKIHQKDCDLHTMLMPEPTESMCLQSQQTESHIHKSPIQAKSVSSPQQQEVDDSKITKEMGQTSFPSLKQDQKMPDLEFASKSSSKQRNKCKKKTECQSTLLNPTNIIPCHTICDGQESEYHTGNIKLMPSSSSQLQLKIAEPHMENTNGYIDLQSSESLSSKLHQKDSDLHTMLVNKPGHYMSHVQEMPIQAKYLSLPQQQGVYESNISKATGQTTFTSSQPDKKVADPQLNNKPNKRKKCYKPFTMQTEWHTTELQQNIPFFHAGQELESYMENDKGTSSSSLDLTKREAISHSEHLNGHVDIPPLERNLQLPDSPTWHTHKDFCDIL